MLNNNIAILHENIEIDICYKIQILILWRKHFQNFWICSSFKQILNNTTKEMHYTLYKLKWQVETLPVIQESY